MFPRWPGSPSELCYDPGRKFSHRDSRWPSKPQEKPRALKLEQAKELPGGGCPKAGTRLKGVRHKETSGSQGDNHSPTRYGPHWRQLCVQMLSETIRRPSTEAGAFILMLKGWGVEESWSEEPGSEGRATRLRGSPQSVCVSMTESPTEPRLTFPPAITGESVFSHWTVPRKG